MKNCAVRVENSTLNAFVNWISCHRTCHAAIKLWYDRNAKGMFCTVKTIYFVRKYRAGGNAWGISTETASLACTGDVNRCVYMWFLSAQRSRPGVQWRRQSVERNNVAVNRRILMTWYRITNGRLQRRLFAYCVNGEREELNRVVIAADGHSDAAAAAAVKSHQSSVKRRYSLTFNIAAWCLWLHYA